tara:strand:- start:862 stop:1077 length:216 start_codon:yes stop_codon:yes gene_type:complete
MTTQDQSVKQIQTRLIEEVGADAVLIVFSKTKKNATTTHIHTWGNMLACKGLAEEAYDHFIPEETEDPADD